jgi:hypothetical protein
MDEEILLSESFNLHALRIRPGLGTALAVFRRTPPIRDYNGNAAIIERTFSVRDKNKAVE